jgi:hypothetical protein
MKTHASCDWPVVRDFEAAELLNADEHHWS